jgi:putative two-component system response regulator
MDARPSAVERFANRAYPPHEITRVLTHQEASNNMAVRVLLADGNESLVTEYQTFLSSKGFVAATATTGLDCVERLRDFQPNVLVLEADLQWGWGEGVLARMFEDTDLPRVPVIVLADPYERNVRSRLAGFPISEFHWKPVMPAMLALFVQRLLQRQEVREPEMAGCPA